MRHLSEERTFDVTHFLVLWCYYFLKVYHTFCTLCLKWVGKFFFWSMSFFCNIVLDSESSAWDCTARFSYFVHSTMVADIPRSVTYQVILFGDHILDRGMFSTVWSSDVPHQNTSLHDHVSCHTVFLWDIEVLAELGNSKVEGFWFECFRFVYMEKYFVRLFLGLVCWIFFRSSQEVVSRPISRWVFFRLIFFFFFDIPTFVQFNRGWELGPVSCLEIDGEVSRSFGPKVLLCLSFHVWMLSICWPMAFIKVVGCEIECTVFNDTFSFETVQRKLKNAIVEVQKSGVSWRNCHCSVCGFRDECRCARQKLISRYRFDLRPLVTSTSAMSVKTTILVPRFATQVGEGCSTTHPECIHEWRAARSTGFSNMFRKIWYSTVVLLGGIRRCSSCCRSSFFAFFSNTTRDVMRVQVVVVLVRFECLVKDSFEDWFRQKDVNWGLCETQCRVRALRVVFSLFLLCVSYCCCTCCVWSRGCRSMYRPEAVFFQMKHICVICWGIFRNKRRVLVSCVVECLFLESQCDNHELNAEVQFMEFPSVRNVVWLLRTLARAFIFFSSTFLGAHEVFARLGVGQHQICQNWMFPFFLHSECVSCVAVWFVFSSFGWVFGQFHEDHPKGCFFHFCLRLCKANFRRLCWKFHVLCIGKSYSVVTGMHPLSSLANKGSCSLFGTLSWFFLLFLGNPVSCWIPSADSVAWVSGAKVFFVMLCVKMMDLVIAGFGCRLCGNESALVVLKRLWRDFRLFAKNELISRFGCVVSQGSTWMCVKEVDVSFWIWFVRICTVDIRGVRQDVSPRTHFITRCGMVSSFHQVWRWGRHVSCERLCDPFLRFEIRACFTRKVLPRFPCMWIHRTRQN